ncbi:MAG TPA: hypothetical protein VN680_00210 [Burkholderiaceae bacterium]|nr:hypothetical protein [Burkholderiaceae bacterium]
MRYAVRCCCTPSKVLGWLHLPAGMRELMVPEACGWSSGLEVPRESPKRHLVKLRVYEGMGGYQELAVYSDDRPLEFWLKLSGFERAPP